MILKDLQLNRSYISYGEDNISKSLINPCLKVAKRYKRSAGFFSSTVISVIIDGIVSLVRNKGTIQLITSQKLNQNDVAAINIGYDKRAALENAFIRDFDEEIRKLDDNNLNILAELIASGIMDIKVAITKNIGMYHDKFGIIEDSSGNKLAFFGSSNSTFGGYVSNYEKVRTARSWVENESVVVEDEENEFNNLWNGENPYIEIYDFKNAINKAIINIIEQREDAKKNKVIVLRDYQEDAISAWVKNKYRGFYVMATGTGKTWTAIYSAAELLKTRKIIIVICAPYKHLVQQWYEDVAKAFPKARIIKVSSENPMWDVEISEEVIRNRYQEDNQLFIISTIMSFNKERFEKVLSTSKDGRMLIVDEAHRFTNRQDWIQEKYKYMLGLSATPYSGQNTAIGDELMEFFGGRVFNLPIEFAIEKGYLMKYSYHPIYVNTTGEEEESFGRIMRRMAACFTNGVLSDVEEFIRLRRTQLRIISMAAEKTEQIDSIIAQVREKDHFIVYCGDGRLFDDNGEELRHIQFIKRRLDAAGYRPNQFTASENMYKRMEIVDSFNIGETTALAAIRCLDEGINIPSIKAALILSSNDNNREFVQRRGRILRKDKNKKEAKIFDVIVLPSSNTPRMAIIEFRRYYEYARLATNSQELLDELHLMINDYRLTLEQIIGEVAPDVEELDE